MNALILVEVFYNKEGSFIDPNSPVRRNMPYHSVIVPTWSQFDSEAEEKVREWFSENKPEYKIIKMISTSAI